MELNWLKQEGGGKLVIFVMGWACDFHPIEHIKPTNCDILCIYDFRDITTPDLTFLELYQDRYLFAWSFGVWVSEQIFKSVLFTRAIALAGTPFPIDDHYGIELKRFAATLRGLKAHGTEEFARRTYSTSYDRLSQFIPARNKEADIEELANLHCLSTVPYTPSIRWNKGVVGIYDVIFPPSNMIAYWGSVVEVIELPHYPFENSDQVIKAISY